MLGFVACASRQLFVDSQQRNHATSVARGERVCFSPGATYRALCCARVMDRNILLQHLAQTERHIAEGEEHLAQQALLIEKLERHGHDSEDARALLN